MGAVLDLGQGQVTFNKLGVTLNLEESATGHHVIDLILGCTDLISDDTARKNVRGPVRRLRGASVKDSYTSAETRKFSNLICDSEKVTIIDVDKPRVSLDGVGCEKFCRRWTVGNFVSDNGFFVVKDERHNRCYCPCPGLVAQSLRKPVMSLRDILTYLTQSEESLIKKS